MRRLVACLALALLSTAGQAQTLHVSDLPLDPADPAQTRLDRLDYRGGLVIASDDARFGGLSALELSADGTRLLALSDSAWWVTGRLAWDDADNRLTGFSDLSIAPVRDADGAHFEGRAGDSEGLTPLGGGHYAVSFEREHRLLAYDLGADWSRIGEARPDPLPGPEVMGDLPNNRGIESLVRQDNDDLVLGVEYPVDVHLRHPLWIGQSPDWARSDLASRPSFGLTGMALHAGMIYAVERFYSRAAGNRIGILTFPPPGPDIDITRPVTLGRIDPPLSVDNFEGIAVIERGGETLVLIVSDDNFSDRQRTLLMAFAVVD